MYVIGSGWWCDNTNKHAGSQNNASSDIIRSVEFFNIWHYFISKYSKPRKIIITDSNSPVFPDSIYERTDVINYVSLIKNFEHASKCDTYICGWTRAFLNGAFYALMNDCDYIFIEQDCLIYGDNIIETAINNLKEADFSHGLWEHSYKVEQSFVVIKHKSILKFINEYMSFKESDLEIRPELKFFKMINNKKLLFKELPFEYGRKRPIDFNNRMFYAQHWKEEEIRTILERENLKLSDFITKKKDKY